MLPGHVLPDLLCGEGEDRGHPADHRLDDEVERGLAGAAGKPVLLRGVLAVLYDVKVEGAHVDGAELHQGMDDLMEVEVVIGLQDLLLGLCRAGDCPAVKLDHVLLSDQVLLRIEAAEVREEEAGGVADSPVGLGGALENLLGDGHVAGVVG